MQLHIDETCPRCGLVLRLTSALPSPRDPAGMVFSFECQKCGPVLARDELRAQVRPCHS
jgi:hypothetical protein